MARAARPIALVSSPQSRRRARPAADLGAQIRTLRQARGLTHAVVAVKARMREAQVSVVESGYNTETRHYAALAKVLGFRGALEMFRAEATDPRRDHLLRAWALLSEAQRTRLLTFANRLFIEG